MWKVVYKLRSCWYKAQSISGCLQELPEDCNVFWFSTGWVQWPEQLLSTSESFWMLVSPRELHYPSCPTSNRVYGPGHHSNWATFKESSYQENLKLFLPLTNKYVTGIPSILSNILLIWLLSKTCWYCALWSFADMHALMNRWGHFVSLITWVVEINHRVIIAIFSTYIMYPGIKMIGWKAQDVVPSAAVKFFGAGTAACIADLVTFPLDTAKVRLQVWGTEQNFQHLNLRLETSVQTFNKVLCHPTDTDSGRISKSRGRQWHEVPGRVWHHHHHGAHWGPQEPLQWSGGGAPETDELRLGPNRPLRLHEAVLHSGNRQWVRLWRLSRCPAVLFHVHMWRRCGDRHSSHGGLHHGGHGCGFCTTNRCGEGAIPSPGTSGWWWEEIQRHPGRVQDDCSRWRRTGPLERCRIKIHFLIFLNTIYSFF